MPINRAKCHYALIVLLTIIIAFGFSPIGHAEDEPTYDFDSSGTMAIIPLEDTAIAAAKEFAQQIQASSVVRISALVYAPPGIAAKLVLSGNPSDLQQALELYKKILFNGTSGHLIVIVASLREMTTFAANEVGLGLVPSVGGLSIANWGRENDGSLILNNTHTATGIWTDMLDLNDALDKSRVLVSSEVYTPNGVKAQIASVKSVPTFSVDNNGNVQTEYQNLETSIAVVPTIIKYNTDKPQESVIRVDVDVKVSIISSSVNFKHISAPEYSVKTMSTTRMLTANNRNNVIGTFTTDSDVHSISGIPILGKLPLLKYLFSQERKETERNTAILTLSVRLLPIP